MVPVSLLVPTTPGLAILHPILLPSWGNSLQSFAKRKKEKKMLPCSSSSPLLSVISVNVLSGQFSKNAAHFPLHRFLLRVTTVLRDTQITMINALYSPPEPSVIGNTVSQRSADIPLSDLASWYSSQQLFSCLTGFIVVFCIVQFIRISQRLSYNPYMI